MCQVKTPTIQPRAQAPAPAAKAPAAPEIEGTGRTAADQKSIQAKGKRSLRIDRRGGLAGAGGTGLNIPTA